jgi:hypothetical protein
VSESKNHIQKNAVPNASIARLSVLHNDSLTAPHLTILNQSVIDTPTRLLLFPQFRSAAAIHFIFAKKHRTVVSAGDIELAQRKVAGTRGFALVASKLNSDADKTTTIYQRFDELSARNLLYQAELAELEEQQKRQDTEDRDAKDQASIECQSDWNKFAEATEFETAKSSDVVAKWREKEKMELALKIRERLEKYLRLRNQIQGCTMRSTNLTQIRGSTSFTSSSS